MRSMSKRDRSVLGGLVLAMIVGVGGSLALAASCLGRDGAHRAEDPLTTFPEDRSARTSSGGVRGEEAIGTTEITSVELPAGAPENAPPPNPNPTPAPAVTPQPVPVPAPTANATVNVHVNGERTTTTATDASVASGGAPAAGDTDTTMATDAGAAPATTTTTPATTGDGGATTNGGDAGATSSAAPAPPPRFLSEPPPYGASSWTANHEAGAGPFTTERNVPDRPGP